MKSILTRLSYKLKYDGKTRILLDALNKCGIGILPNYYYQEKLEWANEMHQLSREHLKLHKVEEASQEEIDYIGSIDRPNVTRALLAKRLEEGNKCYVIKNDDKVIGFSWCNFQVAQWIKVPLKENEAYLFDMYVLPAYRGKGIASVLRMVIYQELEKIGKNDFFSYSSYYNSSAQKFKEKLNAKKLYLMVNLKVFGVLQKNLIVKKY